MGAVQQGANATEGRWLTIARTLTFITHRDDVLLIKRGAHKRVFPNQYNGLGGHIERDEDPLTSAIREVREESGLIVPALRLVAVHQIDTGDTTGILLFVFTGESDGRTIGQTDEGTLEWVSLEKLAQIDLVEDLPMILPRYLKHTAEPFFAHVSYNNSDVIQLRYAVK